MIGHVLWWLLALVGLLIAGSPLLWPLVQKWRRPRARRFDAAAEHERECQQQKDREQRLAFEEASWRRRNEPSRLRRQLAADLLFPGVYQNERMGGSGMPDDGVTNWIQTGTYTRDNPRHLLLISKVRELEAREKAEANQVNATD